MITVSREVGSGGRSIGKELAKRLGWDYYDKELVKQVAEQTGFSPDFIEERGEFAGTGSIFSSALSGRGTPGAMNGLSLIHIYDAGAVCQPDDGGSGDSSFHL